MNPTSEFIQFDNWNIYDINNNWRGYENFLTRGSFRKRIFFDSAVWIWRWLFAPFGCDDKAWWRCP